MADLHAAAALSRPAPPILRYATVGANGGQLVTELITLKVPASAVGSAGGEVSLLPIDPQAVPAPAAGFQLGTGAFVITLTDSGTGAQMSPSSPLALEYRLSSDEINRAGGDLTRLKVATWTDDSWVALSCSASGGSLDCTVAHLSLFALIVAPPPSSVLETPLANGWFYKETNGFNGAGDAGFAVVDDDDANLWTEFQRLGGLESLGYPISKRFQYGGYLTQAFQKRVLQWQPELGSSTPVNVFDDLSAHGADAWLDQRHQIPPPSDTAAYAGLTGDELVTGHLALLDQYSVLHDFYDSDPEATALYGLPLAIKDYGLVIRVRLQRAALQMWTSDVPWAAAGTVVVVNSGDLAKEAGLWAPGASVPIP
jgi:hypothetical protein